LFKYNFLPRNKQKATLSSTITILVDDYLPRCKQKYLFQNYQQLSQYRAYKDFVPMYLHNRPRSVIMHCLDRKAKGEKFPAHSVQDINGEAGIFEVEKESGSKKTVDFGICSEENMPACTCKDWLRFHMPCKHFFAVFQHRANWQWEQLPQSYLHSAYLSTDSDALAKHFDTSSTAEALEQQAHSPGEVTIRDNPPAQVTIPKCFKLPQW